MSSSVAMSQPSSAPSGDPIAYFVTWLRELKELHGAGMLEDEDFAYQKAERICELLNCPRRRWLGWIYVGVPLSVLAALVTWRLFESPQLSLSFAGIAGLCGLAALGRRSRERFTSLDTSQRLQILRELLDKDVITSAEFLGFEERMLLGEKDQFAI